MGDPWGISGPTFIWLYVAGVLVAVTIALVWRSRQFKVTAPPGQTPLTLDQIAFLAGGPDLLVDVAVAALLEREVIRTARGGRLYPVNSAGRPKTVLESDVLSAVCRKPGISIERLRRRIRPPDRGTRSELVSRGLLAGASYGEVLLATLPFVAVDAVGIVRAVNGIKTQRPVTALLALLAFSLIVLAALLIPVGYKTSSAGDRVLGAARSRKTKSKKEGVPLPPMTGAAALVAASGLTAFPDPRIAAEFWRRPSSSNSYSASDDSYNLAHNSPSHESSSCGSSSCGSSCGSSSSCGG